MADSPRLGPPLPSDSANLQTASALKTVTLPPALGQGGLSGLAAGQLPALHHQQPAWPNGGECAAMATDCCASCYQVNHRYLSFGHRHLSFGHRYLSFGHRHLSFGHRYLSFEHRHLSFGHRYLSFGHRHLSFGHRYLSFGHRHLSFGHRYLSFGHRHLSFKHRYLSFGHRHLSFGHRYLSFEHRYLSFGHSGKWWWLVAATIAHLVLGCSLVVYGRLVLLLPVPSCPPPSSSPRSARQQKLP